MDASNPSPHQNPDPFSFKAETQETHQAPQNRLPTRIVITTDEPEITTLSIHHQSPPQPSCLPRDKKNPSRGHVGTRIDAIRRIFRHLSLEPALDLLEHRAILLAADERDADPLGTETAGTTDAMEI